MEIRTGLNWLKIAIRDFCHDGDEIWFLALMSEGRLTPFQKAVLRKLSESKGERQEGRKLQGEVRRDFVCVLSKLM